MQKNTENSRALRGAQAEYNACLYLLKRGLRLIYKNYRTRAGEIDLIMRDGQQVVFVEVRLRQRQSYGGAAASVTPGKQRRLARAAAQFIQEHNINQACRFDVIEARQIGQRESGWSLNWIKNAFVTPADAFDQ